jgi:flagellar hook-associated protein 3 FlgL
MGTRITGLSNYYLFQRSLSLRNAELARSAEQVTSQKRINKPSDDPTGTGAVLAMKQSMDKIEQYQRSLGVAERTLQMSESTLNSVKDVLNRAKELAIQANSPSGHAETARIAIADELQQLQQQLLSLSNTEVNGEYLFSGYRVTTKPFSLDAAQPNADPVATYAGDTNVKSVQINDGSSLVIQSRGDQVFQGDGTNATVDLFQAMATLENNLRSNAPDYSETSATGVPQSIEDLGKGFSQVMSEITSIGAKTNRIDTSKFQLSAQRTTLETFVSDIEQADFESTAAEFQRANLALQATLQSAGTILNLPSLMSFIGR